MSGWGSDWFTETAPISKEAWDNLSDKLKEGQPLTYTYFGTDLAKPGSEETIYGIYTAEGFKPLTKEEFENKFKNTAPTHDPYTNPNSHIYYECGCGAILDPGTKSFAQLNNCASEAGWKVRWGADSYVPYCVKCGEEVE